MFQLVINWVYSLFIAVFL